MKVNVAANRIPILWLLLPFIFGIASSKLWAIPLSSPITALMLAAGITAIFQHDKKPKLWLVANCITLALAGNIYVAEKIRNNETRSELPKREAYLNISIKRIFKQDASRASGLAEITGADEHLKELTGRPIYFSLHTQADEVPIAVSARFETIGILESLKQNENSADSFSNYLKSSGQWGTFTNGEFLEKSSPAWILYRIAAKAKTKAVQILGQSLDPNSTHAHAYQAIILGQKNELSSQQKDIFLKSGSMHLFAISGLHIGIIATCFVAVFQLLRVPKKISPILTTLAIAGFVILTGGGPSAWRALLMIACFFLCQEIKVQRAPINALILSALICLLINPLQLFHAGFQMSYAVVLAILLFGVPLANKTKQKWKPLAFLPAPLWTKRHHIFDTTSRYIIDIACIGISAATVSGLLSLHYFNTLPILGVLSNAFILPLASLAIVAGFCSLFSGLLMISPFVLIFNHSAAALLIAIEWLLANISATPLGHVAHENNSPFTLALVILFLAIFFLGYSNSWRMRLQWMWAIPAFLIGIGYIWALSGA